MCKSSDRHARAEIDISAASANEIIAAPSSGHIEIDFITILPSGGANTCTFSDGVTQMWEMALDDNQAFTFDNGSGNYPIELSNATAFNITLSAATQASGFVLYRVVGENI